MAEEMAGRIDVTATDDSVALQLLLDGKPHGWVRYVEKAQLRQLIQALRRAGNRTWKDGVKL
jgi:hypothetical protein